MIRSFILLLFSATNASSFAQDSSAMPPKVHYSFIFGSGLSFPGRLDNTNTNDFYFYKNEAAYQAKLEIFYNLLKSPKRILEISTGVGAIALNASGFPDPNTSISYSGNYYQVPVNFTIASHRNQWITPFSTIGVYALFGGDAKLTRQDLSGNIITRKTLDSPTYGLLARTGTRFNIKDFYYASAAMEFQADFGNNPVTNNATFITLGFGFIMK